MQEKSKTQNQDKKAQPEFNQNHTCATFISKCGMIMDYLFVRIDSRLNLFFSVD